MLGDQAGQTSLHDRDSSHSAVYARNEGRHPSVVDGESAIRDDVRQCKAAGNLGITGSTSS
jgi:hypothetical protein